MPRLKLKNVYMLDETSKKYKTYDEIEVEYQDNGDDVKFAEIMSAYREKRLSLLETYEELASDMIVSPESFRTYKSFGKNAAIIVEAVLPFLLKHDNEDMIGSNKKLEIEEIVGE